MVKWRIYFVLMGLVYIFGIFNIIKHQNMMDLLDMLASTFSLTALFGYAFRRRILFAVLWKTAFFLCIITEASIAYHHIILRTNTIVLVFGFLVAFPIYYAFYRYAFKDLDIWSFKDMNCPENSEINDLI